MTERFDTAFHPFVIPFLAGMAFVLAVCLIKAAIVVRELDKADRRKWILSLIHPNTIIKNGIDIIWTASSTSGCGNATGFSDSCTPALPSGGL